MTTPQGSLKQNKSIQQNSVSNLMDSNLVTPTNKQYSKFKKRKQKWQTKMI